MQRYCQTGPESQIDPSAPIFDCQWGQPSSSLVELGDAPRLFVRLVGEFLPEMLDYHQRIPYAHVTVDQDRDLPAGE